MIKNNTIFNEVTIDDVLSDIRQNTYSKFNNNPQLQQSATNSVNPSDQLMNIPTPDMQNIPGIPQNQMQQMDTGVDTGQYAPNYPATDTFTDYSQSPPTNAGSDSGYYNQLDPDIQNMLYQQQQSQMMSNPNYVSPVSDPNIPLPEAMPLGAMDVLGLGGLNISDIGKMLLLKKIYQKLIHINNLLKNFSNTEFKTARDVTTEALEYFDVIINNIDQFKDKLNDIIITFFSLFRTIVFSIKHELENLKKDDKY